MLREVLCGVTAAEAIVVVAKFVSCRHFATAVEEDADHSVNGEAGRANVDFADGIFFGVVHSFSIKQNM